MNLETLVERACLESGYNDTDDTSAAAKFARHWDEHIWNAALWKAGLVVCDVSVDPTTNEDHADGIVFLPEVIDRVVAVRSANNQIVVTGQEHYYRMDYDSFTAQGTPIEFNILPPAWFTWRVSAGQPSLSIDGAEADAAATLKLVWLDGAGKRTVLNTTVSADAVLTPASADSITVLAAYKEETEAAVNILETSPGITCVNNYPRQATFSTSEGSVVVESGETGVCPSGTAITALSVRYLNGVGVSTQVATVFDPDPINHFGTATLDGVGAITYDGSGYGSLSAPETLTSLAATDTISPSYQRLRLLPKPTAAFTLKVLGKAKYEPLEFDQQEPALRNCVPALLAFIRGSLKRRGGEIGAAQLEFQEANALLQQVIQIEALQAANNQRFMPEDGYGPEHGLGPWGIV